MYQEKPESRDESVSIKEEAELNVVENVEEETGSPGEAPEKEERKEKRKAGSKKHKTHGKVTARKKGGCKDREFEDVLRMGEMIEREIEELEGGKLSNLEDYSNTEKLLILKSELLSQIKLTNDYLDTLQRVTADFDNFRKRSEKDRENIIKFANEELILKFLDVLDNLERALGNVGDKGEKGEDSFVKGITLIHNQFQKIMNEEGLKVINTTEVAFDPYKHDAMMHVVNNELEENTVTDVFQKGYYLKDKVIRPAKVRISKKEV